MSSLKVNTIQNLSETISISTVNIESGSAKVWCSFRGTGTAAIRDSFNVTSFTDEGVGVYAINFTNPMEASANYSIGTNASHSIATGNTVMSRRDPATSYSPNFISIVVTDMANAVTDIQYGSINIQGTLA